MTASLAIAAPKKNWPDDPYKGLNYFSATDAPLFSQRDQEVDDLSALLRSPDTRVVLLHGISGTGKSSLLRAGLGPRLKRESIYHDRPFFFLREEQRPEDLMLIRATADPIERIFYALKNASNRQLDTVPDSARGAIRDALADPIPFDRTSAVLPILTALKALTAPPQRNIFLLSIDQAEEVLTLPAMPGTIGARQAFFELLEQICFRLPDLRVLVALRTEFYGRFCSYFRIRPVYSLTPRTEVRAGLVDYLLPPLGIKEIAAAIRRPTSEDELEKYDPRSAHAKYGFSFEGQLPEKIADDLTHHTGEASTLPAMQIVCRQLYENVVRQGGRTQITYQDYMEFGGAEGAIGAYLIKAVREAAADAGLRPLNENTLDSWMGVLARVVGRTEGGTVQTLIAGREELIAEAEKRGIAGETARKMLERMINPDWRLLRISSGEGGRIAYSLGHDSLGPSVLRHSAQAAVRLESEARLARERMRWWGAAFALVVAVALAILKYNTDVVIPLKEKIKAIETRATTNQESDFRERLLLLATVLRKVETWPARLLIDAELPKTLLRKILLRSPIYGGDFPSASPDASGTRSVRLQEGKVIVRDLGTGKDSVPSELPADTDHSLLNVGLLSFSGGEALAAFRTGTRQLLTATEGAPLVEAYDLPEKYATPPTWISRADILHGRVRIILSHYNETKIDSIEVLQLSRSQDGKFKTEKIAASNWKALIQESLIAPVLTLDWKPEDQQSFQVPVLAEDCDAYAFLGRSTPDGKSSPDKYTIWFGEFGRDLNSVPGDRALSLGAVAIGRGCNSVVARDDAKLHIIATKQDLTPDKVQSVTLESLVDEDRSMIAPDDRQVLPIFAAKPLAEGQVWLVGWPTTRGLVFVKVLLGPTPHIELFTPAPMLTGTAAAYVSGGLTFSSDGSYAQITQQLNYHSPIQLRAFDLRLDDRWGELLKLTTAEKLVQEACRIAAFQNVGTELTEAELDKWWGDKDTPQPCKKGK